MPPDPLYPTQPHPPLPLLSIPPRSPTDVNNNLPYQLSYLYSSTQVKKCKDLGSQNLPNCSFLFMLTLHLFYTFGF